MNKIRLLAFSTGIFICTVLATVACEDILPAEPAAETLLGEPIADLTPVQLQNHIKGDEEFGRTFGVVDGLGPVFISNSCESCHIGDGKGHPATSIVLFNTADNTEDGLEFDPLISVNASHLQDRAIPGYVAEKLGADIKGSSRIVPPVVTGLGFLEAVTDADILAMADPDDRDGDGISGVPNYVIPPDFFVPNSSHIPDNIGRYIGRFSKKAASIDILHQTANAYLFDMGITSDFMMEDVFNQFVGNHTGDNVPDPEVPASVVRNTVFYLRTLKVPPRRNETNPEVVAGEKLFSQIGCGSCHKPTLTTGASEIKALSNKEFHPYTDLLLHDMGSELDDNFTEGSARTSEWRTAPLWGIGLSEDSQGGQIFLLHDGRAKSIEEAIGFHGGEGAQSRSNFNKLSEKEKQQVVVFIESL